MAPEEGSKHKEATVCLQTKMMQEEKKLFLHLIVCNLEIVFCKEET